MSAVDSLAQTIWDYMQMHQPLKPADAIFALGSSDLRVAERAAELYHQGYGTYVICAGGIGKDTQFNKPEGEVFAETVIDNGVPETDVIVESESTNTGENILFVREMLRDMQLHMNSFVVVQKPYMERRTYATFKKRWPEADCLVTSPQISYADYPRSEEEKRLMINLMVGDLLRIREYPKQGFQIEQEIPDAVWQAGQQLLAMGFDQWVLK